MIACAAALLATAGCAQTQQAQIEDSITVTALPAGDSAARFEATVVADKGVNFITYWGLLMAKASEGCVGGSFSVENSPDVGDIDLPVVAGETLKVVVACHHNRLPNHRVVAAGDYSVLELPVPAGSLVKTASKSLDQHQNNPRLAIEALIGGFVREAYTEQCAGKAVLVQFLATATAASAEGSESSDKKDAQATMHFRCVDVGDTPAA
jgi:hypothetical protein